MLECKMVDSLLINDDLNQNFAKTNQVCNKVYKVVTTLFLAILENPRSKRMIQDDNQFVLCRPWREVRDGLKACPRSKWVQKCKYNSQTCFHYVTCVNNVVDLRAGRCDSTHKLAEFRCCTPSCP